MNRIKELREGLGMSQTRLGTELDVTQETISAYEIGRHNPSAKSLVKMSELFVASIDYIMGISDIRKPQNDFDIDKDEIVLLSLYRKLDHIQQNKAVSYMQGMLEK